MLIETYGYGPIRPNTIMLGETEKPENYEDFAQLILSASRRRQNLVIVREGRDPPESVKASRIDVWWSGTHQNLGLMLALTQMLKRSPSWRQASLVLKTIVSDEEASAEMKKRLDSFIEKVRIEAHHEVLIKESADVFQTIREYSEGADLVLLGMRPPGEDEDAHEYSLYYRHVLEQTRDLPPTALILAAEAMDFYAIFEAID